MKKNLNQKLINLVEYNNLVNSNLVLENQPLKRMVNIKTAFSGKTKLQKLDFLHFFLIHNFLQVIFYF